MDEFESRVAVVTGGASGIGAAMGRAFAGRGAKVVLADIDEEALSSMGKELRSSGAQVLEVPTDVTKLESVERLRDETLARFGAVHIVCNNAGIATAGEIASSSHTDWEYAMGVNFWGVVHGVESFVPRLIEQKAGGHVVNTASMAGLVGMQWLGIYCASKFAVVGLSEALHRELRAHDVGVSILCPMIVDTNITVNSARRHPDAQPDQDAPAPTSAGPMKGSVISAEDVARRVVRGIERKDLYILTHPEQREFLERRAARLAAVFERENWEF